MPNYEARVVRFSVFEVDLRAGELRRNGIKVKLQNQPFQILAMLLERRGEVVTREELRSRLWSADTFVGPLLRNGRLPGLENYFRFARYPSSAEPQITRTTANVASSVWCLWEKSSIESKITSMRAPAF